MANKVQRHLIEQLVGLNRSASSRLDQSAPKVLRSFDLRRDGAYRLAEEIIPNAFSGRYSWGLGMPYSETGMWMSQTHVGKLNTTGVALSGTSVDTLETALLPGVGAIGNFDVNGPDLYTMGAVGYYSGSEWLWDWPRVASVTVTAGGTGSTLDVGTYDVLIVIFAPTERGLVAYQSILDTNTAVTSGQSLTVTLDDVLPAGFGMRVYIANGSQDWGGIPGTNVNRQVFSDGSTAMSIVVDDYDETDATNWTTDAILRLRPGVSSVEPHLQRVWTKASERTFAGPYFRAYDTTGYWKIDFTSTTSSPAGSREDLASTPDSAAMGTAFDSQADAGLIVDGIRFGLMTHAQGTANVNYTNDFYFAKREDGTEVQFGFGFRWQVAYNSSGQVASHTLEYFVEANGYKTYTSDNPWGVSATNTTGCRADIPGDVSSIEFTTNLGTTSGSVVHKDINGNTLDTFTLNPSASAGSTFNTNDGALEVMSFPTPSGYPFVQFAFHIGNFEVYQDAALSSLFDDAPPSGWDGTSSTFSGTNYTWTFGTDYFTRDGYVASESSAYGAYRPESTIAYSDIGFANYASSPEQQLFFALQNSERITALVSTPAGLLVLANNEAFMVRSDPLLNDFATQRVSGTVGCDDGVRPARMGGAVVTIWQGKLFAASFGMGDVDFGSSLTEISRPIYDPDDPFVQVVGDVKRREFVALTEGNKMYRFDIERQAWYTDPYTDTYDNTGSVTVQNAVLPTGESEYGVLYPHLDTTWAILRPYGETSTYDALVEYQDIDAGDPTTVKMWRRIRLYMNEGYDGHPTIEFETSKQSGTLHGYSETDGEWVFTFPAGVVSRELQIMRIVLTDGTAGDYVEPPIVVEYVPRYSRR